MKWLPLTNTPPPLNLALCGLTGKTVRDDKVIHSETQSKILILLKKSRDNATIREFDHNQIAKHDIRIGHVDGKKVERFVIHFRSNGCQWCKQTGGCTMCGFWNETTAMKKFITEKEFINQFKDSLNKYRLGKYPSLSLYNAGSFLKEEEIPFSAVKEIFCLISKKLPDLKQLTIESRAEYITKEKLKALQKILGNSVELAIGIGFESQNDTIRNVLLNKGLSKKEFEKSIDLMNSLNVRSVINLILKPPFLTEREAIEDTVLTTKYVSKLGVTEIHYETMTIEKDTLVDILYKEGFYRLPWLWSIIEVLKRVNPFAKPFLTPLSYIAEATETPKNCSFCTESIRQKIYETYCSDFDVSNFENLNCSCKAEWLKTLQEQNPLSFEERASKILSDLPA